MKAKKSLGQNFFVNQNLAKSIVNIILQKDPSIIVEIGPGKGYFSKIIAENTDKKCILLEKDTLLASDLKSYFPKAEVINTDFLDWDFRELDQYKDERILFFGSLPYNVSKMIIRRIVESEYFNTDAFFIIQKEVAEKYTDKESNLLSLTTKLFANVKKEFDISPSSFSPKPKVTSAFTKFVPKDTDYGINTKEFISFLKLAFIQPRKTLKNNLRGLHFKNMEDVDSLLSKRAQHISLEEYIFLFSQIDTLLV